MKSNYIFGIIFSILAITKAPAQSEYTICLYDSARNRPVPVAVYQPRKVDKHTKVIVFNHGYGQNIPGSYRAYSCLTRPLSEKGYYVISIQHELPEDPPLAMSGNFIQTRMPNWKTGVENIRFTIEEFKKIKPELNWNSIALIGHSNGGDMVMLFATEYPGLIQKAISLDHRRMIMPRTKTPEICTLRGCDYDADEGVIPDTEEQIRYHIPVIRLGGIRHGDMDNKGSKEQHNTILGHLYRFLKE